MKEKYIMTKCSKNKVSLYNKTIKIIQVFKIIKFISSIAIGNFTDYTKNVTYPLLNKPTY